MRIKTLLVVALGFSMAPGLHAAEKADAKRVMEIVNSRCALCHGIDGESASAVFPRLAAQHPEYMMKQLKDFREGRRKGTMTEMAADLKDAEIAGLASYFSAKKSRPKQPGDQDLAVIGRYVYQKGNVFSGVPACASCHGPKGYGTAQLPRLAGQNPKYLETQLKEFNTRERNNDNAIMHTIASKLTELETHGLSAYIGGLD